MRKLAIAAILAAALAGVMSGAALWRTRHLSTSSDPAASEPVEVPDVTNKTVFVVGKVLTDMHLRFKVAWAPSTTVAKSTVISQNPPPFALVPVDTFVELTVSNGP